MWMRPSRGVVAACLGVLALLALSPLGRTGEDEVSATPPALVPQLGHSDALSCAAISPDGRFVATGSHDHRAILWDRKSSREVHEFIGHTLGLRALGFSNDGTRLVTGSDDGTARVWNLATGAEIARFTLEKEIITTVAFTHGGGLVLTGSTLGVATLWRVSDGKLVRTFEGHDGTVTDLALSPDGKTLATVALDGTARLWSAMTGRTVRVLGPLVGTPVGVAFSRDGAHVATGTDLGEVRLWNVADGTLHVELVRAVETEWPEFGVGALCFRPGTTDLLAVLPEGLAALPRSGGQPRIEPLGPSGQPSVWGIDTSKDGEVLFTWNAESVGTCDRREGCEGGPMWGSRHMPSSMGPTRVLLSRDGRWLVTHASRATCVWDLAHGRPVRELGASALALAGDGSCALVDGWGPAYETVLRVEDLTTGDVVSAFTWPWASVSASVLDTDGSHAAVGDLEGVVRSWEVGDASTAPSEVEVRELGRLGTSVSALTLSEDDGLLLAGAADGSAALWNFETGEQLHTFQEGLEGILDVAIDPRGDRILLVSRDERLDAEDVRGLQGTWPVSASIRSVETGEEISRPFSSVLGITCAALSPDGNWLLAGHSNRTLELRSLRPGANDIRFGGLRAAAVDLVFAPDSRRAFAELADGSVLVLDSWNGWVYCSLATRGYTDSWAVWDYEGRFDVSPRDTSLLSWSFGLDVEPLVPGALWDRCYEPNLLARCLGFGDATIRSSPRLSEVHRPPSLKVARASGGALSLHLEDRGGGLGRVAVFVNGEERAPDVRGPDFEEHAAGAAWTVDPTSWREEDDGGALLGLEIRAFDAAGTLSTRPPFVFDPAPEEHAVDPARPRLIPGHAVPREPLAFSSDGRWAATRDEGGPARVWDCRKGVVVRRLGRGCPHALSAAISPDGRLVAVIEGAGRLQQVLKVWNWRAYEVVYEEKLERPAWAVSFRGDPLRLSWMELHTASPDAPGPERIGQRVRPLDPDGNPRGEATDHLLPAGVRWLAEREGTSGSRQHLLLSSTGLLFLRDVASGRERAVEQIPADVWQASREAYPDLRWEPFSASVLGDIVAFSFPRGWGVLSLSQARRRDIEYRDPSLPPPPPYGDPWGDDGEAEREMPPVPIGVRRLRPRRLPSWRDAPGSRTRPGGDRLRAPVRGADRIGELQPLRGVPLRRGRGDRDGDRPRRGKHAELRCPRPSLPVLQGRAAPRSGCESSAAWDPDPGRGPALGRLGAGRGAPPGRGRPGFRRRLGTAGARRPGADGRAGTGCRRTRASSTRRGGGDGANRG